MKVVILIIIILICELFCYKLLRKIDNKKITTVYISLSLLIYILFGLSLTLYTLNLNNTTTALFLWATLIISWNITTKLLLGLALLIRGQTIRLIFILSTIVFSISTVIYGTTKGVSDIRVEHITIYSADLPDEFNNFKIAQFSDNHIGNILSGNDIIDKMVDTINYYNPAIVVQSGDLVNIDYSELTHHYIDVLNEIEAPVYSVLGNHDLGFYVRDNTPSITPKITFDSIREIQRNRLNWILLENQNTQIYHPEDSAKSIFIAGVTYPKNLNHNNYNSDFGGSDMSKAFEGIDSNKYIIFISHTPELFDSLPEKGNANLTLSGHTHNMQMQFNLLGWEIKPASLLYNKSSGLYQTDDRYLYVNDGLGYVLFPFRIGTLPEITIITLKKRQLEIIKTK